MYEKEVFPGLFLCSLTYLQKYVIACVRAYENMNICKIHHTASRPRFCCAIVIRTCVHMFKHSYVHKYRLSSLSPGLATLTESLHFLAKLIDLIRRAVLRRALPQFREIRAGEGRIALNGESQDSGGSIRWVDRWRRRGRAAKKPVDTLGARADAEAPVKLLANVLARQDAVKLPQLSNHSDQVGVGYFWGPGHLTRLR